MPKAAGDHGPVAGVRDIAGRRSLLSLALLLDFEADDAGFQLGTSLEWIPDWGIGYTTGIDGMSLWMVLLTTFLMPIGVLASWSITKRVKPYFVFLLALETGMLGVFSALDMFLFYLFWEATLVPMYFLIGMWGYGRRIYAAMKFFLFTLAGSLLMLVAIIYLYFAAGDDPTFDYRESARHAAVARDATSAVPRVLRFVRGEGPARPVPHMAARRAHRGADRRIGDAGRRSAEDGRVRPDPLRHPLVPRCRRRVRPVDHGLGDRRHHLWGARRDDAEGPQATDRVLIGRAPRLRRARDVRRQRSRG